MSRKRKIRAESIAGLILATSTLVFSCVFSQTDYYRANFANRPASNLYSRVAVEPINRPTNAEFAKALFTEFGEKNGERLPGFFLVSNRLAP
jgi:hypothetical protein